MAKREHGYIALVPVFIPVPKNDLPNQIAAATALHEASQAGSLDAIMGLPGIRLHTMRTKEGEAKPIQNRWGSVPAQDGPQNAAEAGDEEMAGGWTDTDSANGEPSPDEAQEETNARIEAEPTQDEATTTGRRRSRAA